MTHDPFFDPLVKHLRTNLVKYWIGQRLGQCPVTGRHELDIRSALQVWSKDGDLLLVVSPAGRNGLDLEAVAKLDATLVDPAAIRREQAAARRAKKLA